MKKFTLALMALLAFAFTVKAQQYVSTEPANRNVIIEEFTGRGCGYCTDGHRIANQIMANNPGRVWAINIHAGGYAQTSYPNMITADGNTIHGGFSISGYPTGVVNRSTSNGLDRGQWNGQANTQMNQASECNVAGMAQINPDTRVATITVEVYYTGNSTVDENYLTVAMLQDSILGSQSDYGNYNPTQWLNGQYVHMHILRDVITSSAWGEAISPTTQGTLITRTYEYQIPETIGSPNGVEVKLDHIFFLAWVAERQQGNAYRPILTACELEKTTMTNEPIYPIVTNVSQAVAASCSQDKEFSFEVVNIGTDELTSMTFNVQVGDVNQEFQWSGGLPSGDKAILHFNMELPFGTNTGVLSIVEANGEPFDYQSPFQAVCDEWVDCEVGAATADLKLYIIQDQFGEQITWDIINSAGETIAQGGPYSHLIGSGSTYVNLATINDVPADDCYLLRIYDSNNNGICCNYGNGYYYMKVNGQQIFGGEGNGNFGSEGSQLFSLHYMTEVESQSEQTLKVYPNPANSYLIVEGETTSIEVYNTVGQCMMSKQTSGDTQIDLSGFANGMYFLRVYNNGEVAIRKFSVNR